MFLFFSAFLHIFQYEAHKKQHHTHFLAMMMMMIIDCDMIAISVEKYRQQIDQHACIFAGWKTTQWDL